ncbi:MAG: DUF1648 domain-containing protein [Verrucomicrobia bacterium]|nr:DUF1648 domain-containing protein [Verrucomicrobiota bacterium]
MKYLLPMIVWLLALALFIVSVLMLGQNLPDRVATHFGISGQPDGWMTREAHVRFFLLFGAGISVLPIALCYLSRFFPVWTLNIPNKACWTSPEMHPIACAFVFRHSFWLSSLSLAWFATLHHLLVEANRRTPVAMSPMGVVALTLVFLVGLGLWIWSLHRFFRRAG